MWKSIRPIVFFYKTKYLYLYKQLKQLLWQKQQDEETIVLK
jgi:hypothetical protein